MPMAEGLEFDDLLKSLLTQTKPFYDFVIVLHFLS